MLLGPAAWRGRIVIQTAKPATHQMRPSLAHHKDSKPKNSVDFEQRLVNQTRGGRMTSVRIILSAMAADLMFAT